MSTQLQHLLRLKIWCAIFNRDAILRTISGKDTQLVSENRIRLRGHDIALAPLPGFTLPGDISQHFARDVIVPEATSLLLIKWKHRGSGFGFGVDPDYIESRTEAVELSKRKN